MNREQDVIKMLESYNQNHIINLLKNLDEVKKQELLDQIEKIDFHQVMELYDNTKKEIEIKESKIEPISYLDKAKLSQEQSLYDKYDQDFLHKIENFAKQDELEEDEVLEVVREHINRRNNRRVVKDKEEMLRHLIQGLISNPEQYVVQSIKDRNNRIYKPRVKEASLGTKEVIEAKRQN